MVWFAYIEEGYAAEQDNQYCDISSTTIITTDQNGNIINNHSLPFGKPIACLQKQSVEFCFY